MALASMAVSLVPATANAATGDPGEFRLPAVAVPAPVGADLTNVPAATRVAYLATASALGDTLGAAGAQAAPLRIDLFDDVQVTVVGAFDAAYTDGTRTWLGHSPDGGSGNDDAVIVVQRNATTGMNEITTGTVWQDGKVYELRRVAPSVIAVADVAPDAFVTTHVHPETGEPDPAAEEDAEADMVRDDLLDPQPNEFYVDAEAVATSADEAAAGSNAYVDVLVLYTPAAAASTSITSRVAQYIGVANQANANDSLGFRFRAVRTTRYAYTENKDDGQGDLNHIKTSAAIAQMRADAGADLVALVGAGYSTTIQTTGAAKGNTVCGYGYQPDGWSKSWDSLGFSLWDVNSAKCGSTVAAHELGHNITLRHDWANDASKGAGSPYSPAYNHGYAFASLNGFTTIMAYIPRGCNNCPYIPYWSNPNANYNGVPRGMSLSTPTPAYDAKAAGIAAPEIAKWFKAPNALGAFESVKNYPNGVRVTGWAIDPDTRGAINVTVSVDGVAVKTVKADDYRSDVEDKYQGFGPYHGYSFGVTVDGGTHNICVTAVNVGDGGSTSLGCKSFTVPVDPVGNLWSTYTRIPGGAKFYGWALDPDTTNPITVHITVDGTTKATLTANASSPAPSATWADWGNDHGFGANISMTSDVAHQVCLVGVNVGETTTGSSTHKIECISVTLSGDPVGSFRRVLRQPGGVQIQGWALDQDTADYIQVRVSVDGVAVKTDWAHIYDDYVASNYPAYSPYHGFYIDIPDLSEGSHSICVTALNVGGGTNKSLGCKSLVFSHDPAGAFAVTRTAANVVEVTGWAIDPDTYSAMNIRVSVGESGSGKELMGPPIAADDYTTAPGQTWTDAYGYYHGFTTSTVVGLGQQSVCVQADNTGKGASRQLGCVTV